MTVTKEIVLHEINSLLEEEKREVASNPDVPKRRLSFNLGPDITSSVKSEVVKELKNSCSEFDHFYENAVNGHVRLHFTIEKEKDWI
ncbi:hypothetical protein J0871_16940 [Salegentibacter sp. BDJ18]|uniref:hypothetical protein n=1 Tax=Salegentibacter sp. BDJ18 TaxID=2816376 RepID=UPI001AAF9086|nr:hypothetical protein [Salegentibacter sp. BDJ18]MBO2546105.1 hypothetical protein [Salegentibacter sp. BDJ18]